MPSLRKSQSARENGAKSRGPTTDAGKQRSSQNALRHGLTAQTLVLPSEDPADFQRLLDSYLQQFRPAGPIELDLAHEIAAAKWRLNRLTLIETQLLADAIADVEQRRAQDIEDGDEDEPLTPAQSLAKAFDRLSSGSLNFLHRIQSRLERTYSRALQNLLRIEAQRGPSDPPAAPEPDGQNEICTNEPTSPVQPHGYSALDDRAARTRASSIPTYDSGPTSPDLLACSCRTRSIRTQHSRALTSDPTVLRDGSTTSATPKEHSALVSYERVMRG
jgi:hypothetical protein